MSEALVRVAFVLFSAYISVFGASWLDELAYDEWRDGQSLEAIISYKLELQDEVAKAERYRVSVAMNTPKNTPKTYACSIDVGDYDILDDMSFFILDLLKKEQEQVLECLYKGEVKIKEYGLWREGRARSTALLEIKPTRVSAYLYNRELILRIPQGL